MPWIRKKSKPYRAILTTAAVIAAPVGIYCAVDAAQNYIENYHPSMSEKDALAKLGDVRTGFIPQRNGPMTFSTGGINDNCVNVNFTDISRAIVYRDGNPAAAVPVTRRFDTCRPDIQKMGEEFAKNPADPRILTAYAAQYPTEAQAEEATKVFQKYAETVVQDAFRRNPDAKISVAVMEAGSASVLAPPQAQPDPESMEANNVVKPVRPGSNESPGPITRFVIAVYSLPHDIKKYFLGD